MSDAEASIAGPPGLLRRLAAGAWHVPAGAWFLLRHPRLWPLALAPVVVTGALLVAGLFLGVYVISAAERQFQGLVAGSPELLGVVTTLMLWVGILTAGLVLGLGVGLLVSAPLLDRLSIRVEVLVRGDGLANSRGLRWELVQALRAGLYFVAAAPIVFVLNLVPLVGPLLGLAWGAWALALQQTDSPLTRRGLDFPTRKAWHRAWRPESVGFGLAGLVLLIVPVANLLLAPALSAGATLLVLELGAALPAAANPIAEPAPVADQEPS